MVDSFNIDTFLSKAVALGASDEHLHVGEPPMVRRSGSIMKVKMAPLDISDLKRTLLKIAPPEHKDKLETAMDLDFTYEIKGVSRFRVNYNKQLNNPSFVIRNIPYEIKTFEELGLPETIKQFTKYHNGIVLVTGPTGSGKSTTLAAIIDLLNTNLTRHILTIEDPVEFMFKSKKSVISQRQVGIDTESFASGLKYAMRQDPDIILIGEIRDRETISAALKAAETGHLVFSTLHTNDAVQTINRVVNMFDIADRDNMRCQFAEVLRGTIAQKLVYSKEHDRRFAAQEVLVSTSTVRDYIVKDSIEKIYDLLAEGGVNNMISMNKSLLTLVEKKKISKEEALGASNDPDALAKIFRGAY